MTRPVNDAPPCLLLVNGLPGTGKTTIGNSLATQLGWPFISKDILKELIFDGLGWSDKEWSLRVSATVHRIMDSVIEQELRAGHSVIVESNFKPSIDSKRFREFGSRFGAITVQLLCWAQGDVLFDRYWQRQQTDRHPGHVENATREEQRRGLAAGRCEPLEIDGPTIEVDTTDFQLVDDAAILRAVTSAREQ